jgi:hypothetical protein
MISSAQWGAYNKAVESIVEGSRRALEAELTEWVGGHPGAGTAEIRREAERMMRGRVQEADKAAASLAAQWYDAQGKAAGMRLDRAVTSVAFDEATVERVAHYQAQKLEDGDIPGFVEMCSELVGNDAVRSLNATIMRNAARDKRKGVKFARVTSGRNTCPWCLMLAGRGAVYHTRESAGAMGRFHRHCSCKIVPSFSGDKYEVLVEGHDPKKIESRLKDIERITGTRRGSAEFGREVELRDPDWLFGDEPPAVNKERGAKPLPKEREAANVLAENGVPVMFIKEVNKTGVKSPDAFLGQDKWEFKVPGGWSKPDERSVAGEHTIRKQFYKALDKGTSKLLLSNGCCDASFSEMVNVASKVLKSGDYAIDEVLVVAPETGEIRRLKK